MTRVFLTGGSGFLGRNILEQLSGQFEFFAPKHSELDLLDEAAVEKYLKDNAFDVVLHAANRGGSRKEAHLTDVLPFNLRIFYNLVRCQKYFGRMVTFGSGAEYGKQRDIKDIKESQFDERVPKDDYGFYKYVCSKFIEQSQNIVALRIFGLFGKYEDYEVRFISNAICKTLFGLPITMKQNVFFDYVYVNDFVKIIGHFLTHQPAQKFYNIGTGKKIDLLALADIVKKVSGTDLPVAVAQPGLNREYTCDTILLKKEVPGLSFTPLELSISELYNYYQGIKPSLNSEIFLTDK